MQCLYICRCKVLWTQIELSPWLEANAKVVCELFQAKDDVIIAYKRERKMRYGTPPRPVLRHVILADFKKEVPLSIFLSENETLFTFDPLPPRDSINFSKQ